MSCSATALAVELTVEFASLMCNVRMDFERNAA